MLDFSGIPPMKALLWSAIINGVISVPMMVVMMRMGSDRRLMGRFVISPRLKVLGWAATAVMASMVILLGWTLLPGKRHVTIAVHTASLGMVGDRISGALALAGRRRLCDR
jgi:hypothetical protein